MSTLVVRPHLSLKRLVGATAATALVAAACWTAAGAPAQAQAGPPAQAQAGTPAQAQASNERPDEASAAHAARAARKPVEVTRLRTETTQVFANPDGTLTSEEYARPVRVRKPDGWVPVDATLRFRPDGRVEPVATPTPMEFSGGGDAPFARILPAGREFSLGWRGRLPKPTLDASTATYAEVLPGVDLKVTADPEGFSEVLVVKTREAAANPALARVTFTTSTRGMSLRHGTDGVITAVDGTGAVVLGSSQPVMWDSSSSGEKASHTRIGARHAVMGVDLRDRELTVVPDRALLTAPDSTFPLFLDPGATVGAGWTMINRERPNQSYTSYDRNDGAKVGYTDDNGGHMYRSIFTFNTAQIAGKQVLDAQFYITLYHSANCTATGTKLYLTGDYTAGTNWNNHWRTWFKEVGFKNLSACFNQPDKHTEWLNLKSHVQPYADKKDATLSLGLLATNENSESGGWKKFSPGTAKLKLTWNTVPGVPDQLTYVGVPKNNQRCARGPNRPYLATTAPTVSARVPDLDGGTLTTYISWQKILPNGSLGPKTTKNGGNVAANSVARIQFPVLTDGDSYLWQFSTMDSNKATRSSVFCEFTVDATRPATPARVTSAEYPDDGELHHGVGRTGSFAITAPADRPDDVAAYAYAWDNHTQPTEETIVPVTAEDKSLTLTLTPRYLGKTTLYVWSVDKAGNLSDFANPLRYQVSAHTGTDPSAQWAMDENEGATATDSSGHNHTAALADGAGWVAGRPGAGSALSLDGTGHAATSGPVVRTDASFTVAAWVKLTGTGRSFTAVSQDGTRNSAFEFGYAAPENRWALRLRSADSDKHEKATVASKRVPQVGVWTHLAGTYNAGTKRMYLYVNGRLEHSTVVPFTPWHASGPLAIGRALAGGAGSDHWAGQLDDVRAWDRVVFEDELAGIAGVPVLIGAWNLNEGAGATALDSAGVRPDHNGVLTSGVSWVDVMDTDGRPGDGGRPDGPDAARFNGTTGAVRTTGPVLRTDQSFTVAAWVRLNGKANYQVAVSQEGTRGSGFFLQYLKDLDRWAFSTVSADSDTATSIRAASSAPPALGKWTHLVGTYDASTQKIRLYVNGVAQQELAYPSAWHAGGPLVIGCARWKGKSDLCFNGDIADVRSYSGVLSKTDIENLAGV